MSEASPDLPNMPPGIRASQEADGTLLFSLPVCQDRFLKIFLPLFGLPFFSMGLFTLVSEEKSAGWIMVVVGSLFLWFGGYMALGRIELRLGTVSLVWTRIYLKRWSPHALERAVVESIHTEVAVRSNGRPSAWRLSVKRTDGVKAHAFPGSYRDSVILWLGSILSRWADRPFDGKLDRSHRAD
jgi:hypothetical protein